MRAPRFIHQHRFDLAADALLLSSGFFSVVASVGLTLWWLLFGLPTSNEALASPSGFEMWFTSILSLKMLAAGAVLGPIAAWRLHGHSLHWRHLFTLAATPLLIGLVGVVAPALAYVFQWILTPVTNFEYAGPIATLCVFATLFLIVVVHAARDAIAPAGDPLLLERLRLLSLMALGMLVLVVVGAMVLGTASEIGDALAFAMLFGFSGAISVLAASVIDNVAQQLRQPKG